VRARRNPLKMPTNCVSVTRPIYRRLHPSRHRKTIPGVGQDGAGVYVGFVGTPDRFATNRSFLLDRGRILDNAWNILAANDGGSQ
jgi:hypothetical protein